MKTDREPTDSRWKVVGRKQEKTEETKVKQNMKTRCEEEQELEAENNNNTRFAL